MDLSSLFAWGNDDWEMPTASSSWSSSKVSSIACMQNEKISFVKDPWRSWCLSLNETAIMTEKRRRRQPFSANRLTWSSILVVFVSLRQSQAWTTTIPIKSSNHRDPTATALFLSPILTESETATKSSSESDTTNSATSNTLNNSPTVGPGVELSSDCLIVDSEDDSDEWDHYTIPDGDPSFLFTSEYYERRSRVDVELVIESLVPIVTPILAYLSYDFVATTFSHAVEFVANNKWVAVDGGNYQAKILTPTINGVVLPAISVLFATLASTTIRTLRDRQLDIRQAINTEAGDLRAMEYLLAAYPPGELQDSCRSYLLQYSSRLIAESQPRNAFRFNANLPSARSGNDSEMNGVINALARVKAGEDGQIGVILQDQSFQAATRLRQARNARLTALQSTYPPLHYGILAILASGTCTGFLMEGDQELLFFLNAVQLKILWSMLTATFVSTFLLFYDLLNPFSGCYQVTDAVDQLYTIRLGLKAGTELNLLDLGRQDEECKLETEDLDDPVETAVGNTNGETINTGVTNKVKQISVQNSESTSKEETKSMNNTSKRQSRRASRRRKNSKRKK